MDIADYVLVALRTSDLGKKQLGISTFVVPTGLPGIDVRKVPTLGQHAIGTQSLNFTVLQGTQELGLNAQRQLSDLI